MALVCSTAEAQRPDDVVSCIFAPDAHTLVFVVPGKKEREVSPHTYVVFSAQSLPALSSGTAHPEDNRGAAAGGFFPGSGRTIRECLWTHATRTSTAGSEASRLPACTCAATKGDNTPRSAAGPLFADAAAAAAAALHPSAPFSDSLAALRATCYLSTPVADDRRALSTGKLNGVAEAATTSSLVRLHVVRQSSATGTVDVWCIFACGCSALATFAVIRSTPSASFEARLEACVWLPRSSAGVNDEESGVYVPANAACTSIIRPHLEVTENEGGTQEDGEANVELLLLLHLCTSHQTPTPLLHLMRLLSYPNSSATQHRLPRVLTWQLQSQGLFDTGDLFCASFTQRRDGSSGCTFAPNGNEPLRNAAPLESNTGAAAAVLRNVRWLPGTTDATQTYPLLAVLYAAPAVVLGDPCLDTVAVCALQQDEAGAATAAQQVVKGRLVLGPWSVCGLTLAHPSWLFTATLPSASAGACLDPFQKIGPCEQQNGAERKGGAKSALWAFRRARCLVAQTSTELLGVFQRPAHTPFAPSRLLRAACRRSPQWDAKEPQHGFAFVLYGAAGEAARCALDGYPECASAVVLDRQTAMQTCGAGPTVKERQCVARVCALLSGPSSPSFTSFPATAAEGAEGDTAVVLSVMAQSAHGPSSSGNGEGDDFIAPLRHRPFLKEWRGGDRAWRLSIQITQRVTVRALQLSPAATAVALPPHLLLAMDCMLCWTAVPVGRASHSEEGVSLLVSGYGVVAEGPVGVLHCGVFELAPHSSSVPPTSTTTSPPAASLPPSSAAAAPRTGGSWSHRCSSVELAHASLLCAPMDTTGTDLLSCASAAATTHPALPTALSSAVLPVALCWLSDDESSAAVALLRSGNVVGWCCGERDSNSSTELTREKTAPVYRLGVVKYPTLSNMSSSQQELARAFVDLLFGEGAGPADVHMEVVLSASSGEGEGDASTALLVIAAGPLIGVVRLRDGVVVSVMDVRATDPPTTTAAASAEVHRAPGVPPPPPPPTPTVNLGTPGLHAAVVEFRRFPAHTPYSTVSGAAGEVSVGEAFAFLWTGLVTQSAAHTFKGVNQTSDKDKEAGKTQCLVSCVVHLGITQWTDVTAAFSEVKNAGGPAPTSQPRTRLSSAVPSLRGLIARLTPPVVASGAASQVGGDAVPPLLHLHRSASWVYGPAPLSNDAAVATGRGGVSGACVDEHDCTRCCRSTGWTTMEWTEGVGSSSTADAPHRTETHLAAQGESPPTALCLCDAALVSLLWPGQARDPNGISGSSSGGSGSSVRMLRWPTQAEGDDVVVASKATKEEEKVTKQTTTPDALLRRLLQRPLRASTVLYARSLLLSTKPTRLPGLYPDQNGVAEAKGGDANDPTRFRLMQVLYVATMASSASLADAPAEGGPLSRRSSAVLCTVSLATDSIPVGAVLTSSASAVQQVDCIASFVLCCLRDRSGSGVTWHWVPLPQVYARSGADAVGQQPVSVGVTRMLPISASAAARDELRSSAGGAGDGAVSDFYCEGVNDVERTDKDTSLVQGRLAVRWQKLWAALERCTMPPQRDAVFAYGSVDPAMLHWRSASVSDNEARA